MRTESWVRKLALPAILLALACRAEALGYPSKPIRLIVPFPAGGASDVVARTIQTKLSENLGQLIIIDNRVGAAGIIGTGIAAQARADGYTLVLVPSSHAINSSLYSKLPYDSVRDFAPVAMIDFGPYILATHPSFSVSSVKGLIELAKAKPGKLDYPSGGVGSGSHLAGELFKMMARIDVLHVPYKGLAPALVDLVSGQVHFVFSPIPAVSPLIKAGKLKALAVTSPTRSPAMPDLSAVAEDLPGYEATTWDGVLAPAATPRQIILKLNAAIAKVVNRPEIKKSLFEQGLESVGGSPEQFAAYLQANTARFGKLIKNLGIHADSP